MPRPEYVELLATSRREKLNRPWSFFETECRKKLEPLLAAGTKMNIAWIEESGAEQIHNRYILTNLGGVMFGIGLDSTRKTATDDLTLMDRTHYETRWVQYTASPKAFRCDPAHQAILQGTRPPNAPAPRPERGPRR